MSRFCGYVLSNQIKVVSLNLYAVEPCYNELMFCVMISSPLRDARYRDVIFTPVQFVYQLP